MSSPSAGFIIAGAASVPPNNVSSWVLTLYEVSTLFHLPLYTVGRLGSIAGPEGSICDGSESGVPFPSAAALPPLAEIGFSAATLLLLFETGFSADALAGLTGLI